MLSKNIIQTLKKAVSLFVRPVSAFPVLYTGMLLMCYATLAACNILGVPNGWFLAMLLPIADCYVMCGFALLLRRIKLHWLIHLLGVIITTTELFVVLFYHSTISVQVVQLVLETTGQESSEFMTAALHSSAFLSTLLITLLVWGAAYGFMRILRRKPLPNAVIYVLAALLLWSVVRQLSAYGKLARCFTHESISECLRADNMPHLNTPFIRVPYGIAFNMAASRELQVLTETVENTTVDGSERKAPLIVLIIGESYNKHHSPLYEPDYLPTTPRLCKLRDKGNLVVYTDAVSPFNLTSNVFKYMFSTWDDECTDEWIHHTLFPAVFVKAGYKTHFITNQFVAEDNGDFWNYVGGTIFNSPELSRLQFTTRNKYIHTYDLELLQDIPDTATIAVDPTLLIVHFIGQHVGYSERYPQQYAHFTAADSRTTHGGKTGKEISAHYDNATYYNDAVVDSLLRMFDNRDAVCIYLSDHGEEAYDWRDSYDRTNESVVSQEVARNQYEIPLMFYMTDTFMAKHPDLAKQIRQSADRRFISTDISNVLFHLAGIKTSEYKEQHDILSEKYNTARRRIIRYDTDYDVLMNKK